MANTNKKIAFITLCGRTKKIQWMSQEDRSDKAVITKLLESLIEKDIYLKKHCAGYISMMLKIESDGHTFDMEDEDELQNKSTVEVEFGYDRGSGIITTESTIVIEHEEKTAEELSIQTSEVAPGEEDLSEENYNAASDVIEQLENDNSDGSIETTSRTPLGGLQINADTGVRENQFTLPSRFNESVEKYLKEPNKNMPKNTRNEMLRSIAYMVFMKTKYPTTIELHEIVKSAVEKYPTLKTQYGDSSTLIVQKLKRRIEKLRQVKGGLQTPEETDTPPRKRARGPLVRRIVYSPGTKAKEPGAALPPQTEALYPDFCAKLALEWSKLRPHKELIEKLLKLTFEARRQKISTRGGLTMKAILKDFPMFETEYYLLEEFKKILNDDNMLTRMEENWDKLVPLILRYTAGQQKRSPATDLVWQQFECAENSKENESRVALQLLPTLLNEQRKQKGPVTQYLFECHEAGTCTAEEVAANPNRATPIILGIGKALHLANEGEEMLEIYSGKVIDALKLLMAVYYVFDAQYPKQAAMSLRFIQAAVMNRDDSDTQQSISVCDLLSDLHKYD